MRIGKKSYSCSPEGLKLMLAYVQQEILAAKLDMKKTMHIEIAVEEALTNSIRHSGLSVDDKISVKCELLESGFCVMISDRGKPFNPLDNNVKGIGIALMLRLMDAVHYQRKDEMNVLTLIKNR